MNAVEASAWSGGLALAVSNEHDPTLFYDLRKRHSRLDPVWTLLRYTASVTARDLAQTPRERNV